MELRDAGRICLALLGLVCFWGPVTSVHAETAQEFIAKAPQGIALTNAFVTGESVTDSQQQNSAKVITAQGSASQTQAVLVTSAPQQVGTIWSQPGNEFDLTHDVTTSMWMYFGDKREKAADGMALVIHNDPRGLKAMPQFTDKIFGETLGVWGVDNQNTRTDPQAIAATAIQNSWALEFDTFLNKTADYAGAGLGTSFDTKLKGPHIASNYPGDAASYQLNRVTPGILAWDKTPRYYFNLNHVQPIQGDKNLLANGQWHHITLDWQSHTQTMTYTFDDKDPQTGEPLPGKQQAVKLDLQKIDPEKTGKATWGFTGATGSSYANNLVIFENVPGLVETDATATLTDLNTGKVLTDGASTRGTHEVQLDYDLTYEGGKQDWKDVTAKLNLPDNLEFEKINVTYANGDRQTVDPDKVADNQLTFKLDSALSATNQTAKIRLTGTVADQKQASEVAAKTSTFTAVNGVTTTDTVHFTIEPKLDIDLLLTSAATVTIPAGETTTIKAQVFVPEGITITNADLTVHPTLNGKALPGEPIDDPDDNLSGKVRYTPAVEDLTVGKNTIDLYVEDNYGNRSNTITATVNVTGGLTFDQVAKQSSFQQTTLTGSTQRVKRTNDWSVRVVDSRAAGAKWHLQAAVGDFTTSDGQKLAGGLTYSDGQSQIQLNGTPTTIHQGQSSANQDVTDVVDDWTDDTGIQLTVAGHAVSGDYSGQIDWTLTDAPA
ncbi:lectin-like domain-containing protein [Levilactobacillus zymae]|uniref:Extracellular protein n=1 Tax=Levilactobacillus zymae TaxID=267363 RepID=A0A1Y6JXU4_9LACO|nr:WxL domain-containing protein [Levilactobacillus zymae]SMS13912.1 extracellular protein [Levilactobacillus zymae]